MTVLLAFMRHKNYPSEKRKTKLTICFLKEKENVSPSCLYKQKERRCHHSTENCRKISMSKQQRSDQRKMCVTYKHS